MADQHISLLCIDIFSFDQKMQCLVVGMLCSVLPRSHDLSYHRRFHKRKQIKMQIAISILQCHFFDMFLFCSRRRANHIDILPGQNTAKTVQPGGTVMIAADDHHRHLRHFFGKIFHKAVKNLHCLRRRNRFVINIPCDHHRIRLLLFCQPDDLFKNIFLVFPQIAFDQFQSDMQIG